MKFAKLLVVVFASLVALPAVAGPGSEGARWLEGSQTAEAFWNRAVEYRWRIENTALSPLVEIVRKKSAELSYRLAVTRETASDRSEAGVRGEACLKNVGPFEAEDLLVKSQLQYANGSEWIDAGDAVILAEHARLASGERRCFEVRLPAMFEAKREYRIYTWARAEGFEGAKGDAHLLLSTPLEVPHAPRLSERDFSAHLAHSAVCPVGFTCSIPKIPAQVSESSTLIYKIELRNDCLRRGQLLNFDDIATLVTDESKSEAKAVAHVAVSTGARRGDLVEEGFDASNGCRKGD